MQRLPRILEEAERGNLEAQSDLFCDMEERDGHLYAEMSKRKRALLTLDRATQITAGNQIAAKKMSVREAESLVKKIGAEFNLTRQKAKKDGKSRDVKRIEEELSDLLTADVEVRIKKTVRRHGKQQEMGEIAIQFGSLDELNGIIEKLRGEV